MGGYESITVHEDIERVLFSEQQIREGIDRIAQEVTRRYRGKALTVVPVLKGSCIFASDLIRRIPVPLELTFVAARSYGLGSEAGRLEIDLLPTGHEIAGRQVLLVDDILDSGQTLSGLKRELLAIGAAGVETCVFLDKPARRAIPFEADFRVFQVEDLFVVGYGLDFAGRYRNLPYVGALRNEVLLAAENEAVEGC